MWSEGINKVSHCILFSFFGCIVSLYTIIVKTFLISFCLFYFSFLSLLAIVVLQKVSFLPCLISRCDPFSLVINVSKDLCLETCYE